MHAFSGSSHSMGLRIEGRPVEDSESARPGGRLGSPAVVLSGSFQWVTFLRQARARRRLARLDIRVAPNI